ncbi:MAG: transporter substrate-binding domain-containing protein [Pseudomonadota bacterium]
MPFSRTFVAIALFLAASQTTLAQDTDLRFLTVERPPFSLLENGEPTGFSIELMRAIAQEIGRDVSFSFEDEFQSMLSAVEAGEVDGAIANISITAERESIMDFSRPIFESGLQIMLFGRSAEASLWQILFRLDFLWLVFAGFGALFLMGLLVWFVERRKQPYFDRNMREAMFPSFWWALNLVVNGGFEQNVPQSIVGRVISVAMVVSSLFLVSIFVAQITAAITIEAITGSIQSPDDLDGRRVGTTVGSTSAAFLDDRDISSREYSDYASVIQAFEAGELEAVFFDGPILAYYLAQQATVQAHLLPRVFRPEDYGIALPQGSDLREPINRALLRLAESGRYEEIQRHWFGGFN